MARRAQPEAALQRAVAMTLDALGWTWQHVPGEVVLRGTKEERARQMARLKRHGFRPGMPDVMVFEQWSLRSMLASESHMLEWFDHQRNVTRVGPGVAIELKVGRKGTTGEQDGWLEDLGKRGWLTAVCRTMDEVHAVLRHVRPMNGRRLA